MTYSILLVKKQESIKTKLNHVSTSQVSSVRVSHQHQHARINYPFPQVKAIRNYVLIAMFPQIMSLNHTIFPLKCL